MGGQNYSEPIVQNEPVSETTSEFNYATASCINEIEKQSILGKNEWVTSNDYQKKLIEEADKLKPFLSKFDKELKSFVSQDPDEINKVLRENGFKQHIPGIKCDLCLYVMSLLHIKEAWGETSTDRNIVADGTTYKGVGLGGGRYEKNGLLKLKLENNDDVLIYISEDGNKKSFDDVVASSQGRNEGEYVTSIVPHIDYMIEKTMNVYGIHYGEITIHDGIHGNHFILNTGGIDLKEYTAMSATRGMGPQTHVVIDKPFFISIYRPGVPYPYFTDYITKDKWVLDK